MAQTPNPKLEKLKLCEEQLIDGDSVYVIVEKPALNVEGYEKFYRELLQNITPENKDNPDVHDKIYISFVINKEGKLVNFCSSVKLKGLDKFMNKMTDLQPAMLKGEKVNQRVIIPLYIKLG